MHTSVSKKLVVVAGIAAVSVGLGAASASYLTQATESTWIYCENPHSIGKSGKNGAWYAGPYKSTDTKQVDDAIASHKMGAWAMHAPAKTTQKSTDTPLVVFVVCTKDHTNVVPSPWVAGPFPNGLSDNAINQHKTSYPTHMPMKTF